MLRHVVIFIAQCGLSLFYRDLILLLKIFLQARKCFNTFEVKRTVKIFYLPLPKKTVLNKKKFNFQQFDIYFR